MGKNSDFIRGIRYNTEIQSNAASAQKFTERVLPYVSKVEHFVKKEMENGKTAVAAIETVLQNESLKKTYPDLNNKAVYKRIRKILLTKYLNKKTKNNEGR